jgi:endonuclease YncB( thermonuclease family)
MTKISTLLFATVVVALLGLAACSRPAASSLFTQTASVVSAGPAPQIQVLRGDVLVVDGRHLRLVDVVVPQAAPDAHCAAEAIASRQAQLRLEDLTRRVHSIEVTPTGGLDGYGRTLARITLDGIDPAATLIDEGLAVAPQPAGFDWCDATSTTQPAAQRITMLSFKGP